MDYPEKIIQVHSKVVNHILEPAPSPQHPCLFISCMSFHREKLTNQSQMSEKMACRYYLMTFLDEDFNGGEMVPLHQEEIDTDEDSPPEGLMSDINSLVGLESNDLQNSLDPQQLAEHDYVIKEFDAAQEVTVSTSNEECIANETVKLETFDTADDNQQCTSQNDGTLISPVSPIQNTDISASSNVVLVTPGTIMSPNSCDPPSTRCPSFSNVFSLPKNAQSKINSIFSRNVILCSKDPSSLFLGSLDTTGVKNVTNETTDTAPTLTTSTAAKHLQNGSISCTSPHISKFLTGTPVNNIRTTRASRASTILCSSDSVFESPSPKKLKTLYYVKTSASPVNSGLNDTTNLSSVPSSVTFLSKCIPKISKPFVIASVSASSTTLSPSNSPLLCSGISTPLRASTRLHGALPLSDCCVEASISSESTLTSYAHKSFSTVETATAASSQCSSVDTATENCNRSKPIIFSNSSSKNASLTSNIVKAVPCASTAAISSKNQSSIATIPSPVSSSISTSKVHSTTPISESCHSTHYISHINHSLKKYKHTGTNTYPACQHSVGVNTVPALQRNIGIATVECISQHKPGSNKNSVLLGLNTVDSSISSSSSFQSSQMVGSCAKVSSSASREMIAAIVAEDAEPLTQEETDFIYAELFQVLKKALLLPNGPELRFQNSRVVEPGWFLCTCENSISLEWLLSLKLKKSPKGRTLKIIRASDLPWPSRIGFSVNSHEVETNTVLSLLQQQNKKLRVRKWKIVEKKEENNQVSFIFIIDPESENALEEYQWTVCYEFTTIRVYHLGCGS